MAEDMLRMQQEAARRVQRMQEHSRQVFEEHQKRTAESLAAARMPQVSPPPLYTRPPQPPQPVPPVGGDPLAGLDGEQLLLLGLALLLFRSGCRPELAVALLYLAM